MLRSKPVIKKMLRQFGFELRPRARTIQEIGEYPRLDTAGWIVEIIGTQAVGKSTLNNAIYKHLRARWFFREDLEYTGQLIPGTDNIEALHRDIFFKKVGRVAQSDADAWRSVRIAGQCSVVIEQSMTISVNTFPRGFILNEGLFKGFPEEILELSDSDFNLLMKNRAFIYMRAKDPNVALARYRGRVAKRRSRGLYLEPQTDDEVRRRIRQDNVMFDLIFEKAKAVGRPAIMVHAEDDLGSAVERVLEFEKSLSPLRPASLVTSC